MQNANLKKISALIIFILIIGMSYIPVSGIIIQKDTENTASSIDDDIDWWPMFHHDLNHSGYSTSTGPETNNVLWAYQADDKIALSSPAVVDNMVYFGDDEKYFYCINSDTGEEIWKTSIPYGIGSSSPTVADGKVYCGSNIGNGGIYCLNATTGEIIWRYQTLGNNGIPAPAICNGKVFIGAPNPEPGCMYCLDANTGEEIWLSENIYNPTSAAIFNDRIYFGSMDHNVYCLEADDGTVIWKNYTGGGYIHVTIYDDKLYTCGGGGLYCLDLNGDFIWKYTTDEGIYATPCNAYGFVYFVSYYGSIYCLDAYSGEKIWDFRTNCIELQSSPAVADGKIYVGTKGSDEKIYCLDAYSGEKIWDFRTTSYVFSSPAIAGGKLYVGTWEDGEMLCFGGESNNNPPHTPKEILGPTTVKVGDESTFNTSTHDSDGDQLYYKWYWEEGESDWMGPFQSNETMEFKIKF